MTHTMMKKPPMRAKAPAAQGIRPEGPGVLLLAAEELLAVAVLLLPTASDVMEYANNRQPEIVGRIANTCKTSCYYKEMKMI